MPADTDYSMLQCPQPMMDDDYDDGPVGLEPIAEEYIPSEQQQVSLQ